MEYESHGQPDFCIKKDEGCGNAQSKNNDQAHSRYEDCKGYESGCCEGVESDLNFGESHVARRKARTEVGSDEDALEVRRDGKANDGAYQDTHCVYPFSICFVFK